MTTQKTTTTPKQIQTLRDILATAKHLTPASYKAIAKMLKEAQERT